MKIKKKHFMIFFTLIFLFLVSNICYVSAMDELFLVGVVRSIDSKSGIVTVDVKSEGCRGIRSFRVDDISELEGLTGKKISFYIDSSTCKGTTLYKIHKITLLKLRGGRP